MKCVMLAIRPKWCEKICHEIGTDKNGKPVYEKPIEVRKTKPSIPTPFKVFIYCTNQKINGEILLTYDKKVEGRNRGFRENGDIPLAGKVIGEFICDKIDEYDYQVIACAKYEVNGAYVKEELRYNAGACLTAEEMFSYSKGKTLYAWHISQLKIYDKPKKLSEFYRPCSYDGLCFSCKRFKANGSSYDICNSEITRPPQSWMYIEE